MNGDRLFRQPVHQPDQLVAGFRSAEFLDHAVLVRLPCRQHVVGELLTKRRQVKRLNTAVGLGLTALDQIARLEPVDDGHEIGALDTQRFGHLALLEPRIVLDDENDGKVGRAQALRRERFSEVLENSELCTAQPIADCIAQKRIIDNGMPPDPEGLAETT